jgi:hypothetical protein
MLASTSFSIGAYLQVRGEAIVPRRKSWFYPRNAFKLVRLAGKEGLRNKGSKAAPRTCQTSLG